MGKATELSSVQVATRVKPSTAANMAAAAARIDQPIAVWLRIAIMEKLERDRLD